MRFNQVKMNRVLEGASQEVREAMFKDYKQRLSAANPYLNSHDTPALFYAIALVSVILSILSICL